MDPTQFIAALNRGKPAAAYFLRGPDRFLHEECRTAIVAILPADAREWCFSEIEFKSGRLARELEGADQLPMLGSHSYFFFSDPEDFKQAIDQDCEDLQAYLESPSPSATVVFAAVEPDRRRRFIQLLEKKAQVVEMLPLGRREAAAWLKSYLRKAGVEIDPQMAEIVAAKFETGGRSEATRPGVNLLWMRTEIDKLMAAKPDAKRVERGDLDLIVTFREEHEIGKLLGALAERQFAKALAFLRALLASKKPETLLLWCIGDLFRQAIKGVRPYGRGGWARPAGPLSTYEIAQRAARSYSRDELLLALRLVHSTDLALKSSWKDSAILLEFLVWQIITARSAESAPAFELPDVGLGQVW
jgi:DNA polymerase III subunit delta